MYHRILNLEPIHADHLDALMDLFRNSFTAAWLETPSENDPFINSSYNEDDAHTTGGGTTIYTYATLQGVEYVYAPSENGLPEAIYDDETGRFPTSEFLLLGWVREVGATLGGVSFYWGIHHGKLWMEDDS